MKTIAITKITTVNTGYDDKSDAFTSTAKRERQCYYIANKNTTNNDGEQQENISKHRE